MIQVKKPISGPALLRTKGLAETKAMCKAFDQAPRSYTSGRKTFKFKSSIYGAVAVKTALRRAQHDKCSFCESKVTHISYGDVEHFRPKAGHRQQPRDDLTRPGYYWLAYNWENLFFSCQICNQRFKKNLFPLRSPNRRACSHNERIEDESPLFISPAEAAVERLIGFRDEYPFAVHGNARARSTIQQLGLDRAALAERRRDRLGKLKIMVESYRLLVRRFSDSSRPKPRDVQRHLNRLKDGLQRAKQDDAEFAAMARAAIGDLVL